MIALRQSMLRILMLTLFGACAFLLPAQNIDIQSENDKPIEERLVYSRQNAFKVAIHTQGFGAGFKLGKIKSVHLTRNWKGEVVSLRSLKEIKAVTLSQYNTRPFIYGKLNYAYALRFGWGEDRLIYGKPYWGGVEMRWTYSVGASLALLKPYYYYVVSYQPTTSGDYIETIEERTFEPGINILGRGTYTKGFNQIKVSPGVNASLGLSFDLAKTRTKVQTLDIDIIAECFPMGVSIMESERNKRFFITLMLSYNFGSRFNKY
jgi:hypothetical protein